MEEKNNYNFETDPYIIDYFERKADLSEDSIIKYKGSLKQFAKANNETITNIVEKCKAEQEPEIVNNKIKSYSPNNPTSLIKQYYNGFVDYCQNKGNKNSSINDKMKNIQTFLTFYDVDLPRWRPLEDDRKQKYPLQKEDIRFIMDNSDIFDKAVISFISSCGLRVKDCSNITIGMFMEATKEYHNFIDVNDFIDKAPYDMIGTWTIIPNKTKRKKIVCQTFSSPESTYYILQNLKKIKNEYIPRKKKKEGVEIELTKDDALFGSREHNFKEPLQPKSLGTIVKKKNDRFHEWRIEQIDKKIANKELSKQDRDKEIAEIPNLNAHALRTYFINTIDSHSGLSTRACLVMEGHKSKVPTDPNYILKMKDELMEGYHRALQFLSFLEDVETRILTNTQSEKLTKEVSDLTSENKRLQKEISKLKAEHSKEIRELETKNDTLINGLQNRLVNLEKQMPHMNNTNPAIITSKDEPINIFLMIAIEELIDYHKNNVDNPQWLDAEIQNMFSRDLAALKEITYDLVNKAEHKPENNNELERYLVSAIFEMEKNPQLVNEIIRHHNAKTLNQAKLKKYTDLLYKLLAEHKLNDEEKIEYEARLKWEAENGKMLVKNLKIDDLADIVSQAFILMVDAYLLEEIDEDFVMADIEKFLPVNVDE